MVAQKRVLLKDVASSIGVSTTVVSIVLNGKAKQNRISDKMSQLVIKTAQDMKYSPNLIARNLRGGKSQLIGLIVTDISNSFFSTLSRTIEKRAKELNYTVIYASSDENYHDMKKLIEMLLLKGVDGLMIVPCDGSEEIIAELYENNIPLVMVERFFPNLDVSFSCLNNCKATQLATQHLIGQGYRNISLIAYNSQMSNVRDRIEGYEKCMKQAGLSDFVNIKLVNIINPKQEIGKALDHLINKKHVEAVIFTTNTISIQGLYCLNEMGIKIPDKIAVIGFDESDLFNLFYSPITYIKQPVVQIGEEAVNILVDKIKNTGIMKKSIVILEPELVIMKSSLKNKMSNPL